MQSGQLVGCTLSEAREGGVKKVLAGPPEAFRKDPEQLQVPDLRQQLTRGRSSLGTVMSATDAGADTPHLQQAAGAPPQSATPPGQDSGTPVVPGLEASTSGAATNRQHTDAGPVSAGNSPAVTPRPAGRKRALLPDLVQ